MTASTPQVAVIMGSASDWDTMKHACAMLDQFTVPYMKQVISAHRTPELMGEFAHNARANGIKVIIAGAGGAAHLPGMVAAQTTLPVIGVPVQSHALGFAAVDRADARRHPRGHHGDRQIRRHERGPARHQHAEHDRRAPCERTAGVPRRPQAEGG